MFPVAVCFIVHLTYQEQGQKQYKWNYTSGYLRERKRNKKAFLPRDNNEITTTAIISNSGALIYYADRQKILT